MFTSDEAVSTRYSVELADVAAESGASGDLGTVPAGLAHAAAVNRQASERLMMCCMGFLSG
jgi:hypothetical protein